jgi:hypothetical protein
MIPAHELYHQHVRRQQSRAETYSHLLQRIEKKIIHAANMDRYEIDYIVPKFLMGHPLYQVETCMLYLFMKLVRLGYHVEVQPPHTLHIHWRRFVEESTAQQTQHLQPQPARPQPARPQPAPSQLVQPQSAPPQSAPPQSAPPQPAPPQRLTLPAPSPSQIIIPHVPGHWQATPGSNMFPARNLAEKRKVQFGNVGHSYLDELMERRDQELSTWKVPV